MPDGYFLFTTDPYVYRLDLDSGELTVVRESPAGSNGTTLDLDGRLVMCDRPPSQRDANGIRRYHRACRRIVQRTPFEQTQRCRLPLGRHDVLHRPGMAEPHAERARIRKFRIRRDAGWGGIRSGAVRVSQRPRVRPRTKARCYVSNTRHHEAHQRLRRAVRRHSCQPARLRRALSAGRARRPRRHEGRRGGTHLLHRSGRRVGARAGGGLHREDPSPGASGEPRVGRRRQ